MAESSHLSTNDKPAVTIVTGFLGAGKTTWLTRALAEPHGLRLAVVVNDVGAVNIDAALVRRVGGEGAAAKTIELTNGCICCGVRDELAETVAELAAKGGTTTSSSSAPAWRSLSRWCASSASATSTGAASPISRGSTPCSPWSTCPSFSATAAARPTDAAAPPARTSGRVRFPT
jgi:hypothetical protein